MKSMLSLPLGLLVMATNPAEALVVAPPANIVYSERLADQPIDNSDYRASWNAQTGAFTSRFLSDFNGTRLTGGLGENQLGFSLLRVSFHVGSQFAGNQWAFKIAPDAGFGGAIYLDGVLLDRNTNDLWHDGAFTNAPANQLLSAQGLNVTPGNHVLEGYWAEYCCNGEQGAVFSTNGTQWLALSVDNLNAPPVPEPEEWAMLLAGFGLVHWQVKRKLARRI